MPRFEVWSFCWHDDFISNSRRSDVGDLQEVKVQSLSENSFVKSITQESSCSSSTASFTPYSAPRKRILANFEISSWTHLEFWWLCHGYKLCHHIHLHHISLSILVASYQDSSSNSSHRDSPPPPEPYIESNFLEIGFSFLWNVPDPPLLSHASCNHNKHANKSRMTQFCNQLCQN